MTLPVSGALARWWRALNELAHGVLIGSLILYFLTPHLWLVAAAFDANPMTYLKWFRPTLEPFVRLFTAHNAWAYLRNTLALAALSTLLSVTLAVMAGYAMSRLRVAEVWIVAFWITTTIPLLSYLVPYYRMLRSMGLLNTYLGGAIVFSTGNLPYFSWIMKNFFDAFPRELEEAASIDGAGRREIVTRIVLPLSTAPVGLIAAMAFNGAWGDLVAPLVLMSSPEVMPISVGMLAESRPLVTWGLPWDLSVLAPFSILYAVPPALLFVYVHTHTRGLARIA